MAPRKAKSESAGTDDSAVVLDYLRKQNRPYSAIEVSANLHNQVTKAQASKILQKLHQNGEIEGRVSGKQAVYHALQDPSDTLTPEILAALDQEIQQFQDQLTHLKTDEKKARAALAALNAKPRLSDLRQDIARLENEREAIQTRLAALRADDTGQISAAERAELENQWKVWQGEATRRRRICRDLWNKCSEVRPDDMTAQELWECLGLEGTLQ